MQPIEAFYIQAYVVPAADGTSVATSAELACLLLSSCAILQGFLAVEGLIAVLIIVVSFNWLVGYLRHASNKQQDEQITKQQLLRTDGLIFVLLATNVLLLWAVAALVSSLDHPNVTTDINLHYPIEVLPSLLQAFIWSWPALVAKVAMGGSYSEWRQRQQQGSATAAAADKEKNPSGSSDPALEIVTDEPADIKVVQLTEQQQQQP